MQQLLRFEGKTLEEARKNVVVATGKDIDALEVKRHGRELYGGVLGFFQKTRYVIEVLPYPERSQSAQSDHSTFPHGNISVKRDHAPRHGEEQIRSLDQIAEQTPDSLDVNFDRELQMVLQDASILVNNQHHNKGEYEMAPNVDTLEHLKDYGIYRNPDEYLESTIVKENLDHGKKETYGGLKVSETFSSLNTLSELLQTDLLSEKFGQELLSCLAKMKTPAPLPSKTSFILGIIGDVELALKSYETLSASYGNDIDLVIMSDRVNAKISYPKIKSPHDLGEIVMEKRLGQQKTVVIFDQKSYLDTLQKSIMVSVPNPLWAAVSSSVDQNQINALDLCVNGIDALMLYDIAISDNPLRFLSEKWPIAFVDGWRASKAAVLAKLLEAAERK